MSKTLKSLEQARRIKKLEKALEFYADEENWKEETRWTGWAGFGEEPDDRQPFQCYPILEEDKGETARRALKK